MIQKIIKKQHLFLLLKLLFIIASFALILWQADTKKIFGYIKNTNPLYLIAAYLIMIIAQLIGAYRMRFYFASDGLKLNPGFSIGLYFTAMLFNNVLPGGIGGDGYKIYIIGKLTKFPHLRALKIALSERASGLFALLIITAIFYIFANFPQIIPQQDLVIAILTILLIPSYFISIAVLLKEKPGMTIRALVYSVPVQLLNMAIAFMLLRSLGTDVGNAEIVIRYMVLFMISSIASILPVSIGGAGLRELTFFYGAKLVGLSSEIGVTIAFLFFFIGMLCSAIGLLFWHRLEKLYNSQGGQKIATSSS